MNSAMDGSPERGRIIVGSLLRPAIGNLRMFRRRALGSGGMRRFGLMPVGCGLLLDEHRLADRTLRRRSLQGARQTGPRLGRLVERLAGAEQECLAIGG